MEFTQYIEILDDATTEEACKAKQNQHEDHTIVWARPINVGQGIEKKCLVKPPPIQCKPYPFGRVNHLGNGAHLEEIGFDWTVPNFPSGRSFAGVIRTR